MVVDMEEYRTEGEPDVGLTSHSRSLNSEPTCAAIILRHKSAAEQQKHCHSAKLLI